MPVTAPPHPAMTAAAHQPVMVARVAALLATDEPGVLVDATVGAGGHAAALLEASGPRTRLVGIDRDESALDLADAVLADYGERVQLWHAPFDELDAVLEEALAGEAVRGVLYDLGVSSLQLDTAERGFSLQADAPLDMRMDPSSGESAAALLDRLDSDEIARLLRDFGEERHARRIARAIVAARPITRTTQLAEVVRAAVPAGARGAPRHPATRTFQALRIAVNGELDRFRASLPQALERLAPAPGPAAPPGSVRGGRVAVLAYHSLEDRIAKRTLAEAARDCVCPPDLPVCGCGREAKIRLLTRGAERPTDAEITTNPRARSARLRAAERTAAAA